jgi:hypothetical protein
MAIIEGSFMPGVEETTFANPATDGLTFRDVKPEDALTVGELLIRHGRTELNPLPRPFVRRHIQSIAAGETHGVLAEMAGQAIGVFTYEVNEGEPYGKYQPVGQKDAPYGYLAEAVAKPGLIKGLGTMLTETALHKMGQLGVQVAYSIHNTKNKASGGMMLNNAMQEVAVLHQPDRGRDMAVKQKVLAPQK